MTIAKLFARIGLQTDQQKAERFDRSIKGLKVGLVAAVGAATAFSAGVKRITDEAFDAAAAFKQFEAETGSSAQELQKWQSVANQTNNAAQAVNSSIKAITSNQEKIRLGQGDISGYQLLGIDPRQDPFEILEQVRTKTEGMTQAMKKNVLNQIGVSTDLLQVLELSGDEFDAMASRAFIVPQSAIDTLDKARASGQLLGNAINYIKNMIAANLAPSIDDLNKKISAWIKNNQEGIIKTVRTAFDWISRFTQAIGRAGIMINRIVQGTIGWEAAIKGLLVVIGILNASILASPIGIIIAAVILLVAVLDDLYVYSTGKGKSLFGNLMERFPELEEKLNNFVQFLKDMLKLIKAVFQGDWATIDNILDQWGAWGDIIQNIIGWLKDIKDWFQNAGNWLTDEAAAATGSAGALGLGGVGGLGQQANNTTNNVNVNVNTTADAQGTAREVEKVLNRQFSRSQAQMRVNE